MKFGFVKALSENTFEEKKKLTFSGNARFLDVSEGLLVLP